MKMGQFIRDVGPSSHNAKSGTPTMGGGIFLIPVLMLSLFLLDLGRVESWLIIMTLIMFGVIGGIDDLAKLFVPFSIKFASHFAFSSN